MKLFAKIYDHKLPIRLMFWGLCVLLFVLICRPGSPVLMTILFGLSISWVFFLDLIAIVFSVLFLNGQKISDKTIIDIIKKFNREFNQNVGNLYVVNSRKVNCYFVAVGLKPIFMTKILWDGLTPEERLFVIAHELGHVPTGQIFSNNTFIREQDEFTADKFAFILTQDFYVAASALHKTETLGNFTNTKKPKKSDYHPSVEKRIEALRELAMICSCNSTNQ